MERTHARTVARPKGAPGSHRRGGLKALSLEHHHDESVLTRNLFVKGFLGRVMLAPLVHPDGKEILFHELAQFLSELGFQFEVRNERAGWLERGARL